MRRTYIAYGIAAVLPFVVGLFAAVENEPAASQEQPGEDKLSRSRSTNARAGDESVTTGSGLRKTRAAKLSLSGLPEEERDRLFERATEACLENLQPLLDFEVENREVITESETGATVVTRIPRAPAAIYDAVLEKGLEVFRQHGEFSLRSQNEILQELEKNIEVREGDHYIVSRASSDGSYNLSGYYADKPVRFGFEKRREGRKGLFREGPTTAKYHRFSHQPLFAKRFAHLFGEGD